ncbi:MAG: DUF262 domain-containing protein [Myxococcales bacterium]|nr:DUF262 domain-containing protein [Myxococcales bacterium]
MNFHPEYGKRTINELTLLFEKGMINLAPGFQRSSVWRNYDRQRLIESIIAGYPIPNIFLYKRTDGGNLVYDVIDGKQRLETIFMYKKMGCFRKGGFKIKVDLGDGLAFYDWRTICKKFPDVKSAFETYNIQTIEVTGDLAQIIDLFVRINSTGKQLTSGEKRHARYYSSRFLKEADRLVRHYRNYVIDQKILTKSQIDRMKGTELFAELLMSIQAGKPINRKTSLDRAIGNENINLKNIQRLSREFVRTINLIKRVFPELKRTRFHKIADFYSIFMLVWEMDKQKLVLTNKKTNRMAFEMMTQFSIGVDSLREQLRSIKPAKQNQGLFGEYLMTVQGDTDSYSTRERRQEILRTIFSTLFERKDEKRQFTIEQRRILWNSEEDHICPGCGQPLSWNDFTVDHIKAYSKGGKTSLKNAQLMCRSCNSTKGAR